VHVFGVQYSYFELYFIPVIMTLRTYAVWGGNRILKFGLPLLYIVVWAAGFAVTAIFLTDMECPFAFSSLLSSNVVHFYLVVSPSPLNPYIGCYATYTNPIIFMSWVLLLFYDAGELSFSIVLDKTY